MDITQHVGTDVHTPTTLVRLSDYIAQTLADHGVQHVFMLTGGGAMHLNDAFGRHPELDVICPHHEQTMAMAADAYFRLSNRLACINVTTGPGGINALNGVFGAYTDSIGMIVISGQVKRETLMQNSGLPLRQLGDQEAPIVDMVRPITKFAARIDDPAEVRYLLEKALYLAKSGRPGPVWVDVPIDVQAAKIDPASLRGFDPKTEPFLIPNEAGCLSGKGLNTAVQAVIKRLKAAERPVVVVGAGIRLSGAYDGFLDLIARMGIPVTTGWNAHDALYNDHPCYAGRPGSVGDRPGNFAVQNADLVLVLGSRLNIRQVSYNYTSFARAAYKIMVDVDKAELHKPTLSIDLPVHARLQDFIPALMGALGDGYQTPKAHKTYLKWCKDRLAAYPTCLPQYWDAKGAVNPYCFVDALFDQLDENEVVVTADGTACVVTFQAAHLKPGQRLFTNSGSASMGFDLPAAIGAWWANPRERVICIAGDGSIMQNLQELQTIAGQNIPAKIFILNNAGYHSIRQTQNNHFPDSTVGCGSDSGLSFPSFERIANAFRIPYSAIHSHDDLAAGLSDTLDSIGPRMCEVFLDKAQEFAPKLSSRMLDDGRMVTVPLEDMAPFLSRDELRANMIIPLEGEE